MAGGVLVGYACEPDRCMSVLSACCFLDGHCEILGYLGCRYANESWSWLGPGVLCDPNPCPTPQFACCFADGTCSMESDYDCTDLGGFPQGTWSDCIPNLCIPTSRSIATWGRVKTGYR